MGLPVKNRADMVNGFKDIVNTLGSTFTLIKRGVPNAPITAHFVPANKEDTALVNTVGIEAQILVTHGTPTIAKGNKLLSPGGRSYVVAVCHEVFINDVLVGQRLVVKH